MINSIGICRYECFICYLDTIVTSDRQASILPVYDTYVIVVAGVLFTDLRTIIIHITSSIFLYVCANTYPNSIRGEELHNKIITIFAKLLSPYDISGHTL